MIYIVTFAIIFLIILIAGYNQSVKRKEKNRLLEQQRLEEERVSQQKIQEQQYRKKQQQQEEYEKKLVQEQIETIRNNIDFAFALKEISENQRIILLNKLNSDYWEQYDFANLIANCKRLLSHDNLLTNKYGKEIAQKLINHQYWIGMTQEQLIDCKGNPNKIEKEVLKTKTKETYIYGNKNSGDYFVFENNVVTKFVDR